jgi:hypothetical protein
MRTSRKTRPVSILAKRRHTGHPCRCLSASPQPSWQVIRRALRCPQPPAALARPRRGDSREGVRRGLQNRPFGSGIGQSPPSQTTAHSGGYARE